MNRDRRWPRLLAFMLAGLCMIAPTLAAEARSRPAARMKIKGWHLHVRDDRFTGERLCRLVGGERGGRLSFRPGVIVFHFPDDIDTLDAWYRIDGGRAVRWRDVFPELIALGILPDEGPSLANPSEGRVMLPVARLTGSTEVWIRTSARAAPRRFRAGDFTAAIAEATAAGCTFRER